MMEQQVKGKDESVMITADIILQNAISMELRVKNTDVDTTIKTMEQYGFKYKNSWASMELSNYIVIDFWKKELLKSSRQEE
jgi:hypothetical protein